jgi:hypothetical protein
MQVCTDNIAFVQCINEFVRARSGIVSHDLLKIRTIAMDSFGDCHMSNVRDNVKIVSRSIPDWDVELF